MVQHQRSKLFLLFHLLLATMMSRQVLSFCRLPSFLPSPRLSSARFMSTFDPKSHGVSNAEGPFFALGVNLAQQVGGQFAGLVDDPSEMDAVIKGFSRMMKNDVKDPTALMTHFGPELNKILQGRAGSVVDKAKTSGAAYLSDYLKSNPSAKTTASGLVYHSLVEGAGKSPTLSSTVEVHYHGTLSDGTVFDSSVERGQTISFPLGNVIAGWQEGLQLMKEGGKATLIIPSDLAYGDEGSKPVILPGATLRFEVELFKVM